MVAHGVIRAGTVLVLLSTGVLAEERDPYALTLEELSGIVGTSASSLTLAPLRVQPAMVTQIEGKRLERSGASGQLKLMDILVPEMQISTNRAIGHNPAFRGVELFHHWYAFKNNGSDTAASPWEVFSYAVLAEHQWTLNEQWHSFLGVRLDKGRYSDHLLSPTLALVYTPNDRDTWKFIASEAVRFPAQYAARLDAQGGDDTTEEERLKSIELHFQRQYSDELSWQLGAYYQVLDAVDSIEGGSTQGSVGTYDTLGATLVVDYQGEDWDWRLSHGYLDLQGAEDKNGINPSNISASGQGYGEDLNAWANHNTKFNLIYAPGGANWAVNTSLNLLWDYPGIEDLASYNRFLREGGPTPNAPVIARGYDDAFEAIYQVNAGFELRPTNHARFRLDAYNLNELVDDKHSRYTDRVSALYRVLPFTLMFTAEYEF